MARPGDKFATLREFFRAAEFRKFRARHRTNRSADFLGFTPDGKSVVGFWDGSEEPTMFEPDDYNWTQLVTYL